MTNSRWAPLSGIAAVVLTAVGVSLMATTAAGGRSDEEIVSSWNDSGDRTKVWIGTALFALAIVSFVWYASGLRERLRQADGERLAALAFGAALVFAALALMTDVFVLSIAAAIDFGDNFVLDPNTARLVDTFTYLPINAGAMVLSLTVGASSVAARRSGAFPKWVSIPGYVLAPALLLAVPLWSMPLAVFGIWVLATSVVMLRRAAEQATEIRPALAS